MQTLAAPRRSPRASLTSNYSMAYSPDADDNPNRSYGFARQDAYETQPRQQAYPASPPPRVLMEEYLQPAKANRTVTSPDFALAESFNIANADPMAAHLLVETARVESQKFKILSPDELDRLKKEEARLARLIEAGRKKLYIESRVDNTAKLLQKLGSNTSSAQPSPKSPVSPKKGTFLRLRTSMGSTSSTDGGSFRSQNDADSNKLQELAKEVWKLERKQADLHSRKLEHTAGVLQASYQREVANKENELSQGHRPFSFAPMDDTRYGLGINSSRAMFDSGMDGFGFEDQVRSRLREINLKMRGLWSEFDNSSMAGHPQPPGDKAGPAEQLNYLEDCIFSMTESHANLAQLVREGRRRDDSKGYQTEQVFQILEGIWDSIKLKKTSSQEMLGNDATSPTDRQARQNVQQNFAAEEPFTFERFTDKVNAICARATALEKQQSELNSEIVRERETRRQSGFAKDAERSQLAGQLRAAYDQNQVAQDNLQALQAQLTETNTLLIEAREEADMVGQQWELKHTEELTAERNSRKAREHHLTTRLAAKEREAGLLRSAVNSHEARIAALEQSEATAHAELQDIAAQFDAVGADLLAAENRLAAYHASGTDTAESVDRLESEKEVLQEQLRSTQTGLAKVTLELESIRELANNYKLSAEQASERAAQITDEKEIADSESLQLRAEITGLKRKVMDFETTHAKHSRELEQNSRITANLNADKKGLEDEIERLRQQIVSLSTALQEAEDRARASELNNREKAQQLAKLESEKVTFNAHVEQRDAEIHNLQGKLERMLSAKGSELDDLDSKHRQAIERLKESDTKRLKSESALESKSKELDELSKKHVQMSQQLERLSLQAKGDSTERGSLAVKLEQAIAEQQENQAQITTLQKELGDMITDYENLVRIEIDGEKERVALESTVDSLRDQLEDLEKQLNEERIRFMGKKEKEHSNGQLTNGTNGEASHATVSRQSGDGISIAVMRNEFRKMMKEAKAEHHRALRAEQEERRRLEAMLRSLHRENVRPHSAALSGMSLDNASLLSANDVFSS